MACCQSGRASTALREYLVQRVWRVRQGSLARCPAGVTRRGVCLHRTLRREMRPRASSLSIRLADGGVFQLRGLGEIARRHFGKLREDAQHAQLRRGQSRRPGEALGCQLRHRAGSGAERSVRLQIVCSMVLNLKGRETRAQRGFQRLPRCASYGRHCSSPALLIGRRTCSELAVLTARSVWWKFTHRSSKGQVAVIQQPAHLAFKVIQNVFMPDPQDAPRRQDSVPVVHQVDIGAVVIADVFQAVGEFLTLRRRVA
jgi:hypothetical protein